MDKSRKKIFVYLFAYVDKNCYIKNLFLVERMY